ncbi:MAG TPA: gas vesicle structural protein GvpA [Ktedonobacterales bacterium]
MTSARANTPARGQKGNGGGSNNMLLELIDRILDKGIVIDAWARVSVLSIELLTIEARIVVASVETYLRYAEAIGNTALASMPHPQGAQQPQQAAQGVTQGAQQASGYAAPALPQPTQQNTMPQWQPQQAQQGQPAQPAQQQAQQAQQQTQQQVQQAQPAQQQPQQQAQQRQ